MENRLRHTTDELAIPPLKEDALWHTWETIRRINRAVGGFGISLWVVLGHD